MQANIIKIGNSKGIRLSKTILEKYEFGETVNIRLEDDHIIIEPSKNPREKWDSKFKEMNNNGDDELLIPDVFGDENLEAWN